MKKFVKGIFIILLTCVVMFSVLSAAAAVNTDTSDNSDKITVKTKTVQNKIVWNANGGTIGSKKTLTTYVKKGSKLNKLSKAKRTGYTFKGWYTKRNGGTQVTTNTKPAKSLTYFAQWLKIYTLKLDGNGGSFKADKKDPYSPWLQTLSKNVSPNKNLGSLPNVELGGFIFTGWFTSKTGGTKVSSTTKMPAKNMVIYAQWKDSPLLTGVKKGLVGKWSDQSARYTLEFYADGKFKQEGDSYTVTGNYQLGPGWKDTSWYETSILATKRVYTSGSTTYKMGDIKADLYYYTDEDIMLGSLASEKNPLSAGGMSKIK